MRRSRGSDSASAYLGRHVQHCMHVVLGQPAEAPAQTVERLEQALETLQRDQHDHVRFAEGPL